MQGSPNEGNLFGMLPKDLVLLLFSWIPITYVWVLSWSCKDMHNFIGDNFHPSQYNPRLGLAAAEGDITMISLMLKHGVGDKEIALFKACSKGQTLAAALLEWNGTDSVNGLRGAASGGQMDLVKRYLVDAELFDLEARRRKAIAAARFGGIGGHLEVVKYAYSLMPAPSVFYCTKDIIYDVCKSGNVEVVRYVMSRELGSNVNEAIKGAAAGGHGAIIELFRGIPGLSRTAMADAMEAACTGGHVGVVGSWCTPAENWTTTDVYRFIRAAVGGKHANVLRVLIDICERDPQFTNMIPLVFDFPDIMQDMINVAEWDAGKTLCLVNVAISTRRLDLVQTVIKAVSKYDWNPVMQLKNYITQVTVSSYTSGIVTILCDLSKSRAHLEFLKPEIKFYVPIIQEFLDCGSHIGSNYMDAVVRGGSQELVRLLLHRGAKIDARVCQGALFTENAFMCEHLCRRLDPTYAVPSGFDFSWSDYGPMIKVMSDAGVDWEDEERRWKILKSTGQELGMKKLYD